MDSRPCGARMTRLSLGLDSRLCGMTESGRFRRVALALATPDAKRAAQQIIILPITDDKRQGATVAFSQKGYDANLRINIPQMDYLKLRGDYYHFDGKYGGEDDKGFRYGLEVQPINDLRIGVFYDDGGEEFGGDIAYIYNFGIPQKRESKVAFSPDLFSPVLREYSQRIMTAQLGPQLRFITTAISVMTATTITPERVFTTPITMAGMTTTMFPTRITMTATRMASVQATTFFANFAPTVITRFKYLLTLPPATAIRPYVLTITRNLYRGAGNHFDTPSGVGGAFDDEIQTFTLTVVQGSEDFISAPITLTMTTKMTAADVITESPMTIAGMTTTTRLTFFATSTIGAEITTGAAKVDSHLPPSFPPPIFPPSSPIMISYGLAKNGDSWIPAMVIPTFAPFPRHSRPRLREGRLRRESTAAGRRMLMAQSAI